MSRTINRPSFPKTGVISQDAELLMLKPAQPWTISGLGHPNHGIPQGHTSYATINETNQSQTKLSKADQKTEGRLTMTEFVQKLMPGK